MTKRYYLYWLNPDNSKTFWLNETLGTESRFNSYEECYQIGSTLIPPHPMSRLYFEVEDI